MVCQQRFAECAHPFVIDDHFVENHQKDDVEAEKNQKNAPYYLVYLQTEVIIAALDQSDRN